MRHLQNPAKDGKPRPGTLEKLENREPRGTLKKPKTRDTVPSCGHKTRNSGPNVTLEKLYNYKSTFICVLTEKVTEFREQNALI